MLSLKKIYALSMLIAGSMLATPPAGYVEQKLTLNDMTLDQAYFGGSVAVTPDGKTIIVGAPYDGNSLGATAVFKLQQDGWHQYGHKLVAQDTIGTKPRQGFSVAVSKDGTRIASGAPKDNNNTGAVFIFDYNEEKAVYEQTSKIVSSNTIGSSIQQGYRLALSPDGNTLVFSGIGDNNGQGAAWVYLYDGNQWNEQAKLVGSNAVGQAKQGSAIAISADGNTIAMGASDDEQLKGAAYVFTRINSTWTQVGSKLRCTDITSNAWQGTSIALSSDGMALFIGAPNDNNEDGTICKLARSGPQWFQQGNKFYSASSPGSAGQGHALALSTDSKTLLIGAPYDHNSVGAAFRFKQVDGGSSLVQQGEKMTDPSAFSVLEIGHSVAVSGQGETLVIGAPENHLQAGTVWVYYKPEETSSGTSFFDTTAGQVVTWFGLTIGAGLVWYIFEKFVLKKMCHLKCPTCCKRNSGMNEVLLGEPEFPMSLDLKV